MLKGVVGIVFFVLFVFILCGNGEAVRLRCDNQGYRVGVTYDIYCDTRDAPTSNVSWSLVSATGEATALGSCDGINSCDRLSSYITLYRSNVTSSHIRIATFKQETAGTLVCTESHEERFHTDNCTLRAASVYISDVCENHGYEVAERNTLTVKCYITDASRPIIWTLIRPKEDSEFLGSCSGVNICNQQSQYSNIRVYRNPSYGYLTMTGISRETAGTISCSDGIATTQCPIDVHIPAEVGDCNLHTDRSNWTAVGTCNITKIFSALGKFQYRIQQTWQDPLYETSQRYLHGGRRLPFTFGSLENNTDGQDYYSGLGSYSWQLPTQDGRYYYTFQIFPGAQSKFSGDVLIIENPTAPTHNCTDLNYVPESGRVPCVCSTSSMGSPAGRLIWFLGDTILAAGQYGVTSLQFPSDKITRADDRTPGMACSLDWTTGVNVTITNHVAYGPDEVIIGEMASDDVNILLNCTVLGLNPLLPDMIQWGGLCQGQSGFTCQITNSAIVDDRKEVTCTVTNVHNNNHSVTANFTITHYGGSKSSPRFQPEGIAAGAGGVLAVVVVVAVVVLVVMWKRGHHLLSCGQSPSAVYEDTSPTHQDTGFHMYTDLRNSKARPASTNKESAGQQSNRGADNTSAELQHSNDDNMYQNM